MQPAQLDRLARNLGALAAVQPELAARLEEMVSADALEQLSSEAPELEWRGTGLPLAVEGAGRSGVELVLDRPEAEENGWTVLLGLGLGETLEGALTAGVDRIFAWERSPVLIAATLSRIELARALAAGRLRFGLGTDLLQHCGAEKPEAALAHPLLGATYPRERRLLERGLRGVPVALAEGRLFVDQVGDCLARLGYDPFTLDLHGLSLTEIARQLEVLAPRFLMEINHLPGTPEFCASRGIPYVCWEIDPSNERIPPASSPVPDAHVYTYRRGHVEEFRRAGYGHVTYTPLAADVEARQPVQIGGADRDRYAVDVAFVGASMAARAEASRGELMELIRLWAAEHGADPGDIDAMLDGLLAQQASTPFDYRLPELFSLALPEFTAFCEAQGSAGQLLLRPEVLIAEQAASAKRMALLSALGEHPSIAGGPVVWGDAGWASCEAQGVIWAGSAGHTHELGKIYSGARINLDIGRLYQSDIVTMRVFDVLACGGFALVEHSEALEELFDVGVELDSYRSLGELQDKVAHWLEHEEERDAVAARGHRAVRERHTMEARLRGMLEPLSR